MTTEQEIKIALGISLRDYFAAKALQGMLACPDIGATYELFAQEAYQHADAMLDARSK